MQRTIPFYTCFKALIFTLSPFNFFCVCECQTKDTKYQRRLIWNFAKYNKLPQIKSERMRAGKKNSANIGYIHTDTFDFGSRIVWATHIWMWSIFKKFGCELSTNYLVIALQAAAIKHSTFYGQNVRKNIASFSFYAQMHFMYGDGGQEWNVRNRDRKRGRKRALQFRVVSWYKFIITAPNLYHRFVRMNMATTLSWCAAHSKMWCYAILEIETFNIILLHTHTHIDPFSKHIVWLLLLI